MEELDLLKKDWQRPRDYAQVSESDIYRMLHRRSSSIVKWILIISILEVALWTGIGFVYNSDDFQELLHHESVAMYFGALTWINYAVILFFIYLFYKNYRNISATSSTRKLMQDILRTRKTVQYYVWYNLLMLVVSMVSGFITALHYSPKMEPLREKVHEGRFMLIMIAILVVVTGFFLVVLWLFYKLIYGILMRRLLSNYRELKKIEA